MKVPSAAAAVLVLLLAATAQVSTAQGGTPATTPGTVADFTLLDQEGRVHQLSRLAGSRAVVLFVHGIGCKLARDGMPALDVLRARFTVPESDFMMPARRDVPLPDLNLLQRAWQRAGYIADRLLTARWLDEARENNVEFLLLNANPQDDRAALQAEARALRITLPILKDDTQLVARALDIRRTGEAILIDTRTWKVAYRGPIDDSLGDAVRRQEARHQYLGDAIQALIDGRPVTAPPPAIGLGCAITPLPTRAVSYARDVAPLLIEKCSGCHTPGGIGPWVMDRYDTVKGWSAMMREVLSDRRMPPWHADPAIGAFRNDRSLRPDQVRLLVDWIDAGAPRGDGPDPLADRKVVPAPEWPLGQPDIVVEAPRQEIPATGLLDYRYADVALTLDRDVWVRAVDLRPGNASAVHHEFVFVKFPPGAATNQPDFGMGVKGFFAAYVPGMEVAAFPPGSGRFLPKGTVIQFQLHYAPSGRPTSDRSRLGLYLLRDPPSREVIVASAANVRLRVAPLVADQPVEAHFTFDRDAQLQGLFPHMHLRGSRIAYEARYPDGRREMLLSLPRYVFNWQGLYVLKQPLPIPAGTEITVRGAFDNSPSNPSNPDPSREVFWGTATTDEMFTGYLQYTVPVVAGRPASTAAPTHASR